MGNPPQPLGQRGRSRLRVRLLARVITRSDTVRAVLHNLSLTGAQFSTAITLKAGEEAVLQWGKHEAFGEVVWTDGARCGIRFDEIISPNILIATRDLDDAERLPSDDELVRQTAQAWVQGGKVR